MNRKRRYSGIRDYGDLGFVIGFVENGEWVIMGQSIDVDEITGGWGVTSTKEI